jgi:hypothetical protein
MPAVSARLAAHERDLKRLEASAIPADAFAAACMHGSIEFHADCIRFLKAMRA